MMNATLHDVAGAGEETTAYSVGTCIGRLLNLKRMIQLVDLSPEQGYSPIFTKDEMIDIVDSTIDKLNTITYPYKI